MQIYEAERQRQMQAPQMFAQAAGLKTLPAQLDGASRVEFGKLPEPAIRAGLSTISYEAAGTVDRFSESYGSGLSERGDEVVGKPERDNDNDEPVHAITVVNHWTGLVGRNRWWNNGIPGGAARVRDAVGRAESVDSCK
jgi:hypothetical protein